MLSIRIIKSNDCPICKTYLPRLDYVGFEYSIYDADDPANKAQLDAWKVDELPIVQIIDENGNLKWQFPRGAYSPKVLKLKMEELESSNS